MFSGTARPWLRRCALRNYLDLRYVPVVPPEDEQAREAAQLAAHDYEEPQYDVEQALLLARVRPAPDE